VGGTRLFQWRHVRFRIAVGRWSQPMTHDPSIVMIVDDDDDSIRRGVRRLMKSFGFAVETFASAEEFLDSDRLNKTSCLILDVHMPGMNGLELRERLVASKYVIPILFITAFTDDRARVRALKAGAVGYLAKPFAEEELLNCIHAALKLPVPSTLQPRGQ
jgi:FixJ family two-component response regulator